MKRVIFAAAAILAAASASIGSAGQVCEYRVSPTRVELDGAARSGSITIETAPGCAWTVDTSTLPNPTWIYLDTNGGSGPDTIRYQLDAVPSSLTLRQGMIRVRWNTPTAGQNVVVTQTAGPCLLIFNPSSVFRGAGPSFAGTLGWKGGLRGVDVIPETTAGDFAPWRVLSAPDWVTFEEPPLGLVRYGHRLGDGPSSASFSVHYNWSALPRDGTITFCSGQTFQLHQSGRSINTGNAMPSDFDGDGIADVAVFRPSTGKWFALLSSTGQAYASYPLTDTASAIAIPGDFDGDNATDLVISRLDSGVWSFVYSTYSVPTTIRASASGVLPLLADFNGDGRADLVYTWQSVLGMFWDIILSDESNPSRLPNNRSRGGGDYNGEWQWGLAGDVPVPADFDGDHLADLAVWRPSNGMWYIRLSSEDYSTSTARTYQWGLPGDQPIVGDFDGDGRADLAVWRPSDGAWYILFSSNRYNPAATWRIQWGLPGDVPVVNDYDGDGVTDIAVWRPSNGTWYLLLSSHRYDYASARIIQWGLPGDVPLSGRIVESQSARER